MESKSPRQTPGNSPKPEEIKINKKFDCLITAGNYEGKKAKEICQDKDPFFYWLEVYVSESIRRKRRLHWTAFKVLE